MKVGIFGGTFNPVHLGHLIGLEEVRESCALDEILVIPSKKPVHKESGQLASSVDRCAMLKLALEGNPGYTLSTMELTRESPSYTIDTLRDLQIERPGDDFFLILGADSYNEFGTWRQAEQILDMAVMVVMNRPGEPLRRDRYPSGRWIFVDNPGIAISSRDILARIVSGKSYRYLVPAAVFNYIEENRIYYT